MRVHRKFARVASSVAREGVPDALVHSMTKALMEDRAERGRNITQRAFHQPLEIAGGHRGRGPL
jgi:hypothetical protein